MQQAYSRLKFLLEEQRLTRAELQRRIAAQAGALNLKTLYRLADPDRPLERIDLRAAVAICRILGVTLADLIVFAEPDAALLRALPGEKQRHLDTLIDGHDDG